MKKPYKDVRQKLEFTVKQWNKFDVDKQQILTERFEIILTNHKTRGERLANLVKNIDITRPQGKKNLDIAITKMQNGINKFDKAMENFNGAKLFPSQKEYDDLMGSNDKRDIKKIFWGSK